MSRPRPMLSAKTASQRTRSIGALLHLTASPNGAFRAERASFRLDRRRIDLLFTRIEPALGPVVDTFQEVR